jgi:hypothetical protein
VTGSIAATRVIEAVPVTLVGRRRINGAWVRVAHWHGTIAVASGHKATYRVSVRTSTPGAWQFTVAVPENMDWTAGGSAPSRTVTVY